MFKKTVNQSKLYSKSGKYEIVQQETVYYFFFIPVFKSIVTIDLNP